MQNIEVTEVQSSQIKAIGYDAEAKTLRVHFNPRKDGSISRYDYADVPPEVYEGMKAAESVGKFFGANVKNVYVANRLPDLLSEPKAYRCPRCGRTATRSYYEFTNGECRSEQCIAEGTIRLVEVEAPAETMRLWGQADGRLTSSDPRFPNNADYMSAFDAARASKEVAHG